MSSGTDLRLQSWQVVETFWDSIFRCVPSGKHQSLNTVLSAPYSEGRVPHFRLLTSSAGTVGVKWGESTGEWEDPVKGGDRSGEDRQSCVYPLLWQGPRRSATQSHECREAITLAHRWLSREKMGLGVAVCWV